ncbi:MAG: radical SAM protein [bacterium]
MRITNSGQELTKYSRAKIIPVFLPNQGCPNRCIFCNQKEVVGSSLIHDPQEIYPLIQTCLQTIRQTRQRKQSGFPGRIEVAYYGSNFTGMTADVQREFLLPAARAVHEGHIDGIRISTRPDYISGDGLQFLADHGVRTIEIGVQSMDEDVLRKAGRPYSGDQVAGAVGLLHQHRFTIGLHLMVGLPGESRESLYDTVERVIRLSPHFVRIHPTLVIKDTELERMYRRGSYTPLTLEEAVGICKELSLRLTGSGIDVARIGLQSVPGMLNAGIVVAGPFHPALGELVTSSIAFDRMQELLARHDGQGRRLVIMVPERELSIFIGHNRQNLNRLQQDCRCRQIRIQPDRSLEPGGLRCGEIPDSPASPQ